MMQDRNEGYLGQTPTLPHIMTVLTTKHKGDPISSSKASSHNKTPGTRPATKTMMNRLRCPHLQIQKPFAQAIQMQFDPH